MYLLSEFGENSVQKFTGRVFSFLEILRNHPQIGQLELEERGIRSFVLSKQTSIIYKQSEENVVLLSFFDNRSDIDGKLS